MNNNDNHENFIKIWFLQKDKILRYFFTISILSISILLLLLVSISIEQVFAQTYPYIASTRGSFDVRNGNMAHQPNLPSALSILHINTCPGELSIYVHGVWADELQAEEQTDRVFLSLQKSGYNIPVIGFSWDSNTAIDETGWNIAKFIANQNGPKLAKFIVDFKNKCPNDDLRIIAHSMGSRVTLSAIQSLYDSNPHDTISKIVTSVHLLGAAVDDEQVSINNQYECNYINWPPLKCSGEAIGLVVGHFYSLYNSEDNMLAPQLVCYYYYCRDYPSPYYTSENDKPLGAYPIKNIINVPINYNEYSVRYEIGLDEDANGDRNCDLELNGVCTIIYRGDNHFGYMGFRSNDNPQVVYNNDVIGSVRMDWINETD
jgi:hypothetical protein